MINLLFSIETILNDRILDTPGRRLSRTVHYWLPPLVILSVLFLSSGLGYRATQNELTLVLLLIPAFFILLAIMHWPALGLVGLIGTIIIPIKGPSGLTGSMVVVALLLGLWVPDMVLRQRKIQLISSPPVWALLALMIISILSFGVGQLPWFTFVQSAPLGAQLGGLAIFVFSGGVFLLAAHQIRDLRWLQAMTWLFLGVAAFYLAGRMIPGMPQSFRTIFKGGATDSLFWTWLMALAFSQAVFNRKLHPIWRFALGGLVLLAFYAAYIQNSDWKSGWVPAVVVVAAILGFRFWRTALVLVPFAILPALNLVKETIATEQYSWGTRLDAWLIVVEIAKASPLFGLGFGNYRWYTPLFPIRGWAVQFNSHSQYVDIIAQTGVLGLLCFLWFFLAVARLGWRLRERVPDGFARAYVYGALGGLAGTLVAGGLGDWVLPFFYNVGLKGFRSSMLVWLFLGGLLALEQMYLTSHHQIHKAQETPQMNVGE